MHSHPSTGVDGDARFFPIDFVRLSFFLIGPERCGAGPTMTGYGKGGRTGDSGSAVDMVGRGLGGASAAVAVADCA